MTDSSSTSGSGPVVTGAQSLIASLEAAGAGTSWGSPEAPSSRPTTP